MKLLRSAVIVLAVVVMAACLTNTSFSADKGKYEDMQGMCEAKIKDLRDAATALQASDPDLAKGLNDLAGEKEKKMQEMADIKAKADAKKKLLRDSAAVLQKTDPDLAEKLWDMSDHKQKQGIRPGAKRCHMSGMGMMEFGEKE